MRGTTEISARAPRVGIVAVLLFAGPSIASFVCNSAFRVNDQFWIAGLGPDAQAGMGAATFVLILNFAIYFLTVAGCLPQVARATGAGDEGEREAVVRHAVWLASAIALGLAVIGWLLTPRFAIWLGLEGAVAERFVEYLRTGYLFCLPLALAPLVENVLIGMGDTRTPLLLQLSAVSLNFILNPILIYGHGPWPGARESGEWLGMSGAAAATGLSRAVGAGLGLWIITRRKGVRCSPPRRPEPARLKRIASVGAPSAGSIAVYAAVYFLLVRLVFDALPTHVLAGFGVGFNAFEGVAFPFYLGIAIAGASLVGRALGAQEPELARLAVRNVRRVGLVLGALFAVIFFTGAGVVAPWFTDDLAVQREVVLYVRILAFSQLFVALETTSEKTLLGAGVTRPIFWVSGIGNLLRVPLAAWFALHLGWGAAGIYWAINLTTVAKALAFHAVVASECWLARD